MYGIFKLNSATNPLVGVVGIALFLIDNSDSISLAKK